jgi:hypothetical protein
VAPFLARSTAGTAPSPAISAPPVRPGSRISPFHPPPPPRPGAACAHWQPPRRPAPSTQVTRRGSRAALLCHPALFLQRQKQPHHCALALFSLVFVSQGAASPLTGPLLSQWPFHYNLSMPHLLLCTHTLQHRRAPLPCHPRTPPSLSFPPPYRITQVPQAQERLGPRAPACALRRCW